MSMSEIAGKNLSNEKIFYRSKSHKILNINDNSC